MSPRISISLLSAQSDQRLLALARDGHERAFEALVQRYRRPLLRYCRSSMRLADARAEDVLQLAFLQAWLALARGAEVRELRPWLYRIVHNVAVNAMRAAGEPHGELTDAVQADAALARESNLERTIAVREALGEVAELPRMQRQAIFLTAVDGQTHDEVASTLGITEGALRGLLYRARATLRSAAAALTPPPLLEWAAGGGGAPPTAERLAELTAGGGAAGLTGVLLKGAVVAVTAGALATGASVVAGEKSARSQRAAQSDGAAALSIASAPMAPGEALEASPLGSIRLVADRSRAHRRGADRRDGAKDVERRKHRSRGGSGSSSGSSGGGGGERSGSAQGGDGDTGTTGRDRGKSDDGSGSSSGSRERSGTGGREAASSGDGSGTNIDRSAGDGSSSTSASGEQASSGSGNNGSGSGKESGTVATPVLDNSTGPGSPGGESASDAETASGGSARSSGRGGSGSDG